MARPMPRLAPVTIATRVSMIGPKHSEGAMNENWPAQGGPGLYWTALVCQPQAAAQGGPGGLRFGGLFLRPGGPPGLPGLSGLPGPSGSIPGPCDDPTPPTPVA